MQPLVSHRRARRGMVAAATVAAALAGPASASAFHGITAPISVDPAGAIGNDSSVAGDHLGDYADMTPDGRFVVFASLATNLVPGDTNGVGDVFVRDRRTGATERVSIGLKGAEGDGDSGFGGISAAPSISDDGRYVAFQSEASNLVRGDRNGVTDAFVHDRVESRTERVSVDGGGDEAPGGGDSPAISPDGRYVAFETSDIDGDFAEDVYLRDRAAGTTDRISVSHDGSEVFGTSDDPVVANGPVVAFSSSASNLVPEDDDSNVDVFVRDLSGATPVTERVSVSSDEQPGEFSSSRDPSISADARYVAFSSNAQNFTATPQTRFFSDVFVRDRQEGTTELASPSGTGGEAGGQSEDPEISQDGRFVAFASFAPDLVAGTTDPDGTLVRDAFVRDTATASTALLSVASDDTDATRDGNHDDVGAGPVSADGLVVVLGTQADNLFAGDDNLRNDVYVRDRRAATDLSLAMSDAPDPAAPKGTVTYTLAVTNGGANPAVGTGIVDTLPQGLAFAGASPECTYSDGRVTCELGTLAPGASRTVTIDVRTKQPGVFTNTATVGSLVADPDGSDNTATTDTTVAK